MVVRTNFPICFPKGTMSTKRVMKPTLIKSSLQIPTMWAAILKMWNRWFYLFNLIVIK